MQEFGLVVGVVVVVKVQAGEIPDKFMISDKPNVFSGQAK